MSDNIARINGQDAAFYADEQAWHGKGVVVKEARSWSEVVELAQLNWSVSKLPLFGPDGMEIEQWGVFKVDQSGKPEQYFGPVGKVYTEIQNEYMFNFVDTILGAANGAHYDSAGALGNGERVWVNARIPELDYKVAGVDEHRSYLLFASSHDASLSAICKSTSIRVVCQNTLTQALAMNSSFTKVKHTKAAESKLEAAKKLMKNAVKNKQDIEDKLNLLARRVLTRETYMDTINAIFPVPKGKENETNTRRDNVLLAVTKLFESNDGDKYPEFRGTAYNLLNAVTEYVDHERGTRISDDRRASGVDESKARWESAIWGSGDKLKSQALELVLAKTATCTEKPKLMTFDEYFRS
jgi:phage/plasmid-like protein (TIGR03299 family)